jgi:hypothetical protein
MRPFHFALRQDTMKQAQNSSPAGRSASGALGAVFLVIAARQTHMLLRAGAAIAGVVLLARAFGGYRTLDGASSSALGSRSRAGAAIDDSIEASFPASDPPASRLPDEPPSNADEKWEAVKAAGKAPG